MTYRISILDSSQSIRLNEQSILEHRDLHSCLEEFKKNWQNNQDAKYATIFYHPLFSDIPETILIMYREGNRWVLELIFEKVM